MKHIWMLWLCCSGLLHAESFSVPSLKKYHDSGRYEQALTESIQQAMSYVSKRVERNQQTEHPEKLAMVLDIDETSLSNYDYLASHHFKTDQIVSYLIAGRNPAIPSMLNFYNQALKQGVHVFFVTGRRAAMCDPTRQNLKRAGYAHWSGVYCRPDQDKALSVIPFKSAMRASIAKQGYTVIASIGDQKSDFQGGYTEKGFKLPNPFYYLP